MLKIIIFFFPVFLLSQQKVTPENIENKLKQADMLERSSKTNEAIKVHLSILEDSKSIGYSKGIYMSSFFLAYGFNRMNQYKKSMEYLKMMEAEKENKYADEHHQIYDNMLYSNNYHGMNMYDEAIIKLKENVKLSKNVQVDSLRTYLLGSSLSDLAVIYGGKKSYDSASLYGMKAINVLKGNKLKNPIIAGNLKIAILNLADIKFEENEIDSTEYYIKWAQSLPIDLGYREFHVYQLLGKINHSRKNYNPAIANYKKGLELAKKAKFQKAILEQYSLLADVYNEIGEFKHEKYYLKQFSILSDSIKDAETANLQETIQLLVKDKQEPLKEKNTFLFYSILLGVAGLSIFIFFAVKKIGHKNKVLQIKNEENKTLHEKINLAFEEVVQLAKSDSPEFVTRFQEVYPDFFPNLFEIQPQLLNTELKFCALLFLNFSTKEIASYTFVQPQSIQTKKNRLRKKLNISSDEDLYVWMKNINHKNSHLL